MSEQKTFDSIPPIVSASEPHMALLFLLDVSSSMSGEPIQSLNESINRFKEEVCQDPHTEEILDVAIVAFNHSYHVVQPFTPVKYMEPINLTAEGGTEISPAARIAVEMVDERSRFYRHTGTEPYKPWIFMISDGFGGDVSEVAQLIRQKDQDGFLRFWALGVEGYDSKTLHELAGERVMKLQGYDFKPIFNWVNKSMRAVSSSAPSETPRLDSLPSNVDKDVNSWL